jgi:hypothetical protein
MTQRVLQALRRRTSHRGLVIVREAVLLDETMMSAEQLRAALDRLVEDGVVQVLSPLPFLVLKWSGSNTPRVPSKQQISEQEQNTHMEVPVSSSSAAAATQQREVGGAGEGGPLLEEVLTVLGREANREEFRRLLAGYPAALIHRCLKRVEATKQIRVSKAALFRSLLTKLST